MTPRISLFLAGMILAAFGLFATVPQTQSKADPVEAARLNNLGAAYMNQQLFEKGLKAFQQAAGLDPKLAIARLNEGIALLNLQKIDEAKAALEDALKQDPKNPNAWYNLGLLAKNTGDAQAAIDAFKHVIEIDANDADTWYFLGSAYVQAREFPPAIDAFQHALQLNPLHASAEFGLSRAYQQSTDVDHAREHLKKFQYITQNKLGSPMSLAYGEQGKYSRAVESPSAVLKAPAQIKVQFVDVTREAGIVTIGAPGKAMDVASSAGPGACFLDYDGDGKVDILLPDNGAEGGLSLYHNLGEGKFEEVTKKAGLDPTLHAIGCTAGDYDNDGATDLVLTSVGGVKLLHNEKNGTFRDVTQGSGIKSQPLNLGATFVDYDHDGDLDLYVGVDRYNASSGYIEGDTESTTAMWRNNGNGTFEDVSASLGLKNRAEGIAAIGTDFNNDRAVDLIVSGALFPPTVYLNPREGKFIPFQKWPQGAGIGVGLAVADFYHDGWMDVALTQRSKGLAIWRNKLGKSFELVQLPQTNWLGTFGVAAIDYDNDGWVDLVAVGETKEGKGEVRLFRNLGSDGFKDVTADVGPDKIHLTEPRAIITGDYDADGATDLPNTHNHGPAVLLRNEDGD